MPRPSEQRLREVFNTLEAHIEGRYGIPVLIKDVPAPFTGDLDGAEIHVDYDEKLDGAVFIIAHLFGHTVQWNTDPSAREIGQRVVANPTQDQIAQLRTYEQIAVRYSIQLLHDAGIRDLDQWISDFGACDLAYLEHFYKTGEKRPFLSFWRDGQPTLSPLAIPPFHPTQWVSRWQGVVV